MKLLFIASIFFSQSVFAQTQFAEKCIGIWKGTIYIYSYGNLKDSVPVQLTVAATATSGTWVWKTEYFSVKTPAVKDYLLRLKDKEKNLYVTDEGDSLTLDSYVVGDKMYNIFETENILLTSSYELRNDELCFEVSSGKKLVATHPEVTNYSVSNLQRVILKRVNR